MRALALDPHNQAAHNDRASLQLRTNRYESARDLAQAAAGFETALRADPRGPVSRGNLDLMFFAFFSRTPRWIFMIASLATLVRIVSDATLARLAPAFLLVVPALFTARFVHWLTPPLRGYLAQRLRNPFVAGAIACQAIAAAGLIVGAGSKRWSWIAFLSALGFAFCAGQALRVWARRDVPQLAGHKLRQRQDASSEMRNHR